MRRNSFFAVLAVVTLSSLTFLGCDPGPSNVTTEPASSAVEVREEIPLGKQSEYLQLLQSRLDEKRSMSRLVPATLDDVFIIPGEKKSYLAAKGKDANGQCANIAIELESVNNGEVLGKFSLLPEEHTCAGSPCTFCTFIRDEDDNIAGCDCQSCPTGCNPSGGLCNHSVSSGS